jgi:DNA-binding NtrC family response regulator
MTSDATIARVSAHLQGSGNVEPINPSSQRGAEQPPVSGPLESPHLTARYFTNRQTLSQSIARATVLGMKKPSKKTLIQRVTTTRRVLADKGHILLLGYERPVRETVASMLTAGGYQCREATGGLKALTLLEAGEKFDLILTDLVNDRLGGIGLLEVKTEHFPDIPLALITTVGRLGYALEGMRNGAYDYLLMPFESEQLSFFVRRALEDRRLILENRSFQERLGTLPAAAPRRPKRILVQDDEEPIREIINAMLSSERYECHLAETPQETLDILATREIDLVLCGVLEWMEKDFKHMIARYPNVPVGIVTGVHDINAVLQPIRNGAYDFLLKPFEREQLFFFVRRALEHRFLKLEHDAYSLLTKSDDNAQNPAATV